jgi:predicted nucleic acid-binding protein
MRKKRIYLDTSVVSYLLQEDAPQERQDTQALWEILKTGKYDIQIASVMVDELSKCAEPKRTALLAFLAEIEYSSTTVEGNAEIKGIEAEINHLGILPPRSENDRLHIAAALYRACDIIVSWNFKHMVNVKTIDGVRIVCAANNLKPIDIYSPAVLLERRTSDE